MDLYHVINRGVDKRKIFLDDRDRLRFVHNMFEFNDRDWVQNSSFRFYNTIDIGCRQIAEKKKRKLLVDIRAFCLMPNHYHLLLSPIVDKGIPKFMHKLNMGYSKYFNLKYNRTGTLFEGKYKSVLVKEEAHFIHLPYYIHFNPLDLRFPEWRGRKLRDYKKAIKFLESYRWSSHLDYLGKKNFPSVLRKDFLLDVFGGSKNYKESLYNWLKELDQDDIKDLILE